MSLQGSSTAYHQSFFTGPSHHHERLASGADTPYATMRPYFDEWNATMQPWGGQGPSSFHFYMECRHNEAQIYFVEEEVERSTPRLSPNRSLWHLDPKWITFRHRVHLLINSKETSFGPTSADDARRPWHVPVERSFRSAPVDITGMNSRNASILVQLNEFCQYVSFPLANCVDITTTEHPLDITSTTATTAIIKTSSTNRTNHNHHRSKSHLTHRVRKDKPPNNPVHSTFPSLPIASAANGGNGGDIHSSPPPVHSLPYVRPVDDGLLHASIQPSAEEWQQAMRPPEQVNSLN